MLNMLHARHASAMQHLEKVMIASCAVRAAGWDRMLSRFPGHTCLVAQTRVSYLKPSHVATFPSPVRWTHPEAIFWV